ncbi:MAG: RNA 2',3'-cyclic phosphodiesterase [Hydrogenothermaceae bacterium]|nr:RNA 2',3'-cyclic phosphodiesterase [Hydrogenothermaceae bacterium]
MSSSKRIFIGTFIEIEDIDIHLTHIKKDFGGVISGRWVKRENLHLTFKFIGNVPLENVWIIKEKLSNLLDIEIPVVMVLKGVGTFPNPREPKVLYIKVEPNQVLIRIKEEVENVLFSLGFSKDIKPFIPHVTINRIKEAKTSQLLQKIEKYEKVKFGEQIKVKIDLIESILNSSGTQYKPI